MNEKNQRKVIVKRDILSIVKKFRGGISLYIRTIILLLYKYVHENFHNLLTPFTHFLFR